MPEADDPTVADEGQAEAPQSEAEEPTSTPVPWGDDFDPERAWKTITHLRDREKELEPNAKALERLRAGEDRDTFRELAEKFGYEIPDDEDDIEEPEDETVEDDPNNKRLAEIERKIQEREAAEAAKQFEDHLDQLATGKEVELTSRQRKQILRDSLEAGFSPEATEKAFNDLIEELSEYEKRAIERYTGSKKTPAVPPSGKSATQVPDLSNEKERHEWLKQRLAAQ